MALTLQQLQDYTNDQVVQLTEKIDKVAANIDAISLYKISDSIDDNFVDSDGNALDFYSFKIGYGYIYNGDDTSYRGKTVNTGDIFIRTSADTFTIIPGASGTTFYPTVDSNGYITYTSAVNSTINIDIAGYTFDSTGISINDIELTAGESKTISISDKISFPEVACYYNDGTTYQPVYLDYTVSMTDTNTYSITVTSDLAGSYRVVIR